MIPPSRRDILATRSGGPHAAASHLIPVAPGCSVRLTTRAEGAALMSADDALMKAFSSFDVKSRMKTDADVTTADYRAMAGKAALEFTPQEARTARAALAIVKKNLAPVDVSGLPAEVNLVVTDGSDDGAGPYTRGESIVVRKEDLDRPAADLARDLTHEMFHILSRNDPKLRDELYSMVGFEKEKSVSLELTPDVAWRRFTNPDALDMQHVTRVHVPGRKNPVPVVPMQLADEKSYHVPTHPAYFDTKLELIPLKDNGRGTLVPREENGSTVVLDPAKVPDYFTNIHSTPGPDSEHPDESLAYKFEGHLGPNHEKPTSPDLAKDFIGWREA